MYFTTYDPWALDFQRRFERLARHTFGQVPSMPLDVVSTDSDVTLRFDVPGIDPESIEVTVDRGYLTVTAKRQEERAEDGKFYLRERTMGTFTRRLRLSEALNADAIEASYDKGVLQVRIPVAEQAKPRKIEVRKVEITKADDGRQLAA